MYIIYIILIPTTHHHSPTKWGLEFHFIDYKYKHFKRETIKGFIYDVHKPGSWLNKTGDFPYETSLLPIFLSDVVAVHVIYIYLPKSGPCRDWNLKLMASNYVLKKLLRRKTSIFLGEKWTHKTWPTLEFWKRSGPARGKPQPSRSIRYQKSHPQVPNKYKSRNEQTHGFNGKKRRNQKKN